MDNSRKHYWVQSEMLRVTKVLKVLKYQTTIAPGIDKHLRSSFYFFRIFYISKLSNAMICLKMQKLQTKVALHGKITCRTPRNETCAKLECLCKDSKISTEILRLSLKKYALTSKNVLPLHSLVLKTYLRNRPYQYSRFRTEISL